MLEKITTYIKEGVTYYSIELYQSVTSTRYHLLEVIKKKEELIISKEKTVANTEEIISFIKKRNAPLLVTINTKNIITKIIDLNTNTNSEAIVHSAFPNLNFNTFYYQITQAKTNSIISIAKKYEINEFLNTLKAKKLLISYFTLGISNIQAITNYINSKQIYLSNVALTIDNNSITAISPLSIDNSTSFNEISDLKTSNDSTLNFASIVNYVSKNRQKLTNFNDTNHNLERTFKNNRIFNLVAKSSLILILSILLINFLIFSHYFSKVEALETTSSANTINKSKLQELKTRVEKKEELVNTLVSAANSKSSYYLDIIAQSIPSTILLDEIQYQPLTKPVRASKPIVLNSDIISIAGTTVNGSDFSLWIENLEKLKWVTSVKTYSYDYSTKNTSSFSININTLKNEK